MQQWPKRAARFWEEIPFLRILLPFLIGIALYDAFPQLVSAKVLLAITVALLVLLFVSIRMSKAPVLLRFLLLGTFFGVAGYGVSAASDIRKRADWIGNIPQAKGPLLIEVSSVPKATAKTWRMEAKTLSLLDSTSAAKPVCGKMLFTVFKHDSLCPFRLGDTLLVPAQKLQPHSSPSQPFGFDSRQFYARQNNYHQLLLPTEDVVRCGRQAAGQESLVASMNGWAMQTFRRNVSDADTRALLQAMLLGNEEAFDPDLRQTYADTGVIHIVAISGSHLATLFLMFFFIPYLIRGPWGRRLQYGLGMLAVWLYVMLAGAPPSAIRAAAVFTLLAVGVLLEVRHHTLNTLLAGVFFILCFQPLWMYAVGFQLSVLSVLSIVLFYPHVRAWLPVKNWILRVLWEAVALSFCAQILVAPLSVYYFHNFPLLFLFANVVAWLLVGVVAMFGGIGVLLFAGMPVASRGIADITAIAVRVFNRFIRTLQEWNFPHLSHLQLSFSELLLLYGFIGATAVWLLYRNRKALLFAGASLAVLLGISIHNQHTALRQDRLVVYSQSNALVADYFHGRHFQPLFKDSTFNALKTTRTGYRAWRRNKGKPSDAPLRIIAGKTVLFYNDSANRFATPLDVPVDVLLLARPLKGLSPTNLQTAFHPKIIVAGGGEKRWRLQVWKDSCKAIGQAFHATPIDGAYMP